MPTMTIHLLGAMLVGLAPGAAVGWDVAPDAVRAAVAASHPDAEVREVKMAPCRAVPEYQVKLREADGRVRLEVAPDGTIREERTEIRADGLPEPVAATLADRFPGRRVVLSAERVVATRGRHEETTYEVEMTVDGRVYGVIASPAGAILDVD
jgi:hypothetical protein